MHTAIREILVLVLRVYSCVQEVFAVFCTFLPHVKTLSLANPPLNIIMPPANERQYV